MANTASIGVDVGGSFTDLVYSHDGRTVRAKAPTNPVSFGEGVLAGLHLLAEQEGCEVGTLLASLDRMGLGTTAVTNVVTALSGPVVGVVTTAGFEDELNLADGIRPSDSAGRVNSPVQLVPRRLIVGLTERVDRFGEILTPLDEAQAVEAAQQLVAGGAETIALSLVSSYQNPQHEQAAAAAIRAALPDLPVFVSTELSPIIGFFQRTVFTVLNAYSASSLDGVEEFVRDVQALGLEAPLRLIDASGGAIGVGAARRVPLSLMHSGPAAGVSAAAALARTHDLSRVIACDMGGTSFDVSVVSEGRPLRKLNAEVLEVPTSMSVVDVQSIGSGGGSIGWVDARGMLRVGPRSARSTPGPACYGRGGTEPTVTDALLVLGFIDGDHFLGGSMKLDRQAALDACASVGETIGLSGEAVARGIYSLALADMVAAVRLVFNRRGLSGPDHSIVSYGGCGSLFTAEIARMVGATTVVVPEVASVLSAYGAATASVRHERSQSLATEMPVDPARFETVLETLTSAVNKDLDNDHVPPLEREIRVEADLRYKRQRFELTVSVQMDGPTEDVVAAMEQAFYTDYTQIYGSGSSLLGAPVELVTLRVIGRATTSQSFADHFEVEPAGDPSSAVVSTTSRSVLYGEVDTPTEVPVYDSASLSPGSEIAGPACVDKVDTTTWLPPGATARVTRDGSLFITLAARGADHTEDPR